MNSIPFSAPMIRALSRKTQTRRKSGLEDLSNFSVAEAVAA